MSGGITQLVAIGAQDAHIVGNPEVSFFRSSYKRHTNFAQNVERQVIQGAQSANGMSTVRFERKGDLLSQVYFTAKGASGSAAVDWSNYISKVELLIGGQVIDDQDYKFSNSIAKPLLDQTPAKRENYNGASSHFYPLRFWFCENSQCAIPLVALQYHDVELRITWGATPTDIVECFANFVSLDTDERQALAAKPMTMLIYQVQKAIGSGSKIQELNFNHPVKFLASSNTSASALCSDVSKIKLQINGVDIADEKYGKPNFTTVKHYYNTTNAYNRGDDLFLYPFCLDTSKHQPSGSLNFSRLDSARILSDNEIVLASGDNIYGVNLNVLRVQNGMGGLMYAN